MRTENKKRKDIFCSFCKKNLSNIKHRRRVNYPFGKKSKPNVTRFCSRCENSEKYDERQKEMGKIMTKVMERRNS